MNHSKKIQRYVDKYPEKFMGYAVIDDGHFVTYMDGWFNRKTNQAFCCAVTVKEIMKGIRRNTVRGNYKDGYWTEIKQDGRKAKRGMPKCVASGDAISGTKWYDCIVKIRDGMCVCPACGQEVRVIDHPLGIQGIKRFTNHRLQNLLV